MYKLRDHGPLDTLVMTERSSGPSDDAGASTPPTASRRTYTIEEGTPYSVGIINALDQFTDIDPFDIPLYETINPDALDELFARRSNGKPRSGGYVRFTVADHRVTVHSGRYVEIEEAEAFH